MTKKNEAKAEWLPTLHTAVALGCSVQTLYRWTSTKGFPESAVRKERFGNLYDVEAIRTWAASRAPSWRGRHLLQVETA